MGGIEGEENEDVFIVENLAGFSVDLLVGTHDSEIDCIPNPATRRVTNCVGKQKVTIHSISQLLW